VLGAVCECFWDLVLAAVSVGVFVRDFLVADFLVADFLVAMWGSSGGLAKGSRFRERMVRIFG
jgi:hypothetical protein